MNSRAYTAEVGNSAWTGAGAAVRQPLERPHVGVVQHVGHDEHAVQTRVDHRDHEPLPPPLQIAQGRNDHKRPLTNGTQPSTSAADLTHVASGEFTCDETETAKAVA